MDTYGKLGRARRDLLALVQVTHHNPATEQYIVDRIALSANATPSLKDLIGQAIEAIDEARAEIRTRAAKDADHRAIDR